MVQYLILLTETVAFLGLNISFLFTVRASANPYSPDVNFYVAVAAWLISKSTQFVSEGPCRRSNYKTAILRNKTTVSQLIQCLLKFITIEKYSMFN